MKEGRLGAGWFLPVALILLVVDQATKFMVEQKFRIGLELPILPGYFSITRVHNTGVAFGLGQGNNLVTGILAVGILVVATWVVRDWDWQKRWIQWVTGLVAGGAVGNLVDRVRLGYVLDFLDFHYGGWSWPAFNVADAAISVGVGLVVWSWLMGKTPEKRGGSGRAD